MTAIEHAKTVRWLLGPSVFVRCEHTRWLRTRPVITDLVRPRVRARRSVGHHLRAGPESEDGSGDEEPPGVELDESLFREGSSA